MLPCPRCECWGCPPSMQPLHCSVGLPLVCLSPQCCEHPAPGRPPAVGVPPSRAHMAPPPASWLCTCGAWFPSCQLPHGYLWTCVADYCSQVSWQTPHLQETKLSREMTSTSPEPPTGSHAAKQVGRGQAGLSWPGEHGPSPTSSKGRGQSLVT